METNSYTQDLNYFNFDLTKLKGQDIKTEYQEIQEAERVTHTSSISDLVDKIEVFLNTKKTNSKEPFNAHHLTNLREGLLIINKDIRPLVNAERGTATVLKDKFLFLRESAVKREEEIRGLNGKLWSLDNTLHELIIEICTTQLKQATLGNADPEIENLLGELRDLDIQFGLDDKKLLVDKTLSDLNPDQKIDPLILPTTSDEEESSLQLEDFVIIHPEKEVLDRELEKIKNNQLEEIKNSQLEKIKNLPSEPGFIRKVNAMVRDSNKIMENKDDETPITVDNKIIEKLINLFNEYESTDNAVDQHDLHYAFLQSFLHVLKEKVYLDDFEKFINYFDPSNKTIDAWINDQKFEYAKLFKEIQNELREELKPSKIIVDENSPPGSPILKRAQDSDLKPTVAFKPLNRDEINDLSVWGEDAKIKYSTANENFIKIQRAQINYEWDGTEIPSNLKLNKSQYDSFVYSNNLIPQIFDESKVIITKFSTSYTTFDQEFKEFVKNIEKEYKFNYMGNFDHEEAIIRAIILSVINPGKFIKSDIRNSDKNFAEFIIWLSNNSKNGAVVIEQLNELAKR